ncbi:MULTISPECIES: hypothetical protein [Aneurinibacillus]|uniref:YqzN/YkzM domain-containing protein n=1 Tax=Aneurinibacillus thermoaerophilus TaxID=143495 RepID=A0ABX8YEK9_ANETH|nr:MULTISPECIES: hypothetical protein [Aneurinibacillus]AMA74022.1 hypothetical protein ACH33_15030 [Aneurinibacillus sp. XH2]MED0675868.1 hypothetical protein [Aneurinibacillus thermoaerophilus]MED0737224.1 hypothetical protein [Aneurinibacillus thermoaerophilus]QYY43393.1 hypothetical protein K3F53_03835 [Aneurinibacillus thermoaerophilus]
MSTRKNTPTEHWKQFENMELTKSEMIEQAPILFNAERFEMAGALHDVGHKESVTVKTAKRKLDSYLKLKENTPVKERMKENVNSEN